MAYLDPTTLRCETCGFQGQIEVVVGVGPGSKKGDVPYRNFRQPGRFVEVTSEDTGSARQLACPEDGTIVWTNQAGKRA